MIHEQGQIDMHCDYCGTHYQFDAIDAQALFAEGHTRGDGALH